MISNTVDPITSIHLAKRGSKYSAEAGVLKRTDTFPIYFFQGLSFLNSEITLNFAKLYYVFEERFFSGTIIL